MTSALEIFESDKRENYSKVVLHKKLLVTLTNKDDKQQDRNEQNQNSNLDQWRTRQEAERERIRKLDHTPQPPERPPKKLHLRPHSPPTIQSQAASCDYKGEITSGGSVQDKINIFSPKETNTMETSLTTLKSTFKSSSSFQSSMKSSSSSIEISESTSSLRNYHQKICHNIPKKKPAVAPKPVLSRYSESTRLLNREHNVSTGNVFEKESNPSISCSPDQIPNIDNPSLQINNSNQAHLENREIKVYAENDSKNKSNSIISCSPDQFPSIDNPRLQINNPYQAHLENIEFKVSAENVSEKESTSISYCSPDQFPSIDNQRLEIHNRNQAHLVKRETKVSAENVSGKESNSFISCSPDPFQSIDNTRLQIINNQGEKQYNTQKDDGTDESRDPNLSSDLADHMELFGEIDNQSSSPVSNEMLELRNRRKELVERMKINLDLLKSDKEELLVEVEDNTNEGVMILKTVSECGGSMSEIDKVKVHVTEVDRLTTLLVVLDVRMDRTEKLIRKCSDDKLKEVLEKKRKRLISQIQEAKDLKCFRDKRGDVILKILQNILSKDLMKKYQTFIENKVSLIQELKTLEDKIQMGEEQLSDLRQVNS